MIIKLTDEMVDEITVQNLIDSLQCNREQSNELLAKSDLEDYEAIDLADQLKICRHLECVLEYYLSSADFERRVGRTS